MTAFKLPWVKRLMACLGAGLVLALMVGSQEGTSNGDFGIAFLQATGLRSGDTADQSYHFPVRTLIFLVIGVILFAIVTTWQLAVPYLKRPGFFPLSVGFLGVLISQFVMNWYDPLPNIATSSKNARYLALQTVLDKTSGLKPYTVPFFDYLSWLLLALAMVGCGTAIVLRNRIAGYVTAAFGIIGALLAYLAHQDVVNAGAGSGAGADHSLGMW